MEIVSSRTFVDSGYNVDDSAELDEYDILLLADNHRRAIRRRQKLLQSVEDPFARLDVMYQNNLRAMSDPYIEQVAYYLEQKERLINRRPHFVR